MCVVVMLSGYWWNSCVCMLMLGKWKCCVVKCVILVLVSCVWIGRFLKFFEFFCSFLKWWWLCVLIGMILDSLLIVLLSVLLSFDGVILSVYVE